MSNHSRRAEDRIRELCAKVIASKDSDELEILLTELRSAIHQAIQRVRMKAVVALSGRGDLPNERRKPPEQL